LMARVGVVGLPLLLNVPNANHVAGFYLLLDLPSDVDCTRLYWSNGERLIQRPDRSRIVSGHHVLSVEDLPPETRADATEANAELQLRRSAEVWMLGCLTGFLAFFCAFLF